MFNGINWQSAAKNMLGIGSSGGGGQGQELFYLDYFNGMSESPFKHSDTIRVFYKPKGKESSDRFVLSAPYKDELKIGISNEWGELGGGIAGQLSKAFQEGIKTIEGLAGGIMQTIGGVANSAGANIVGDWIGNGFGPEAEAKYNEIRNGIKKSFGDKASPLVAESMKTIKMSFDDTKIYHHSTINLGENSISIHLELLSSESLKNWIMQTHHYNVPSDFASGSTVNSSGGTSGYCISMDDLKKAADSGEGFLDKAAKVDNAANESLNESSTYSYNLQAKSATQPLKTYCSYLLNRFGGFVGDPGSGKNTSKLSQKRVTFIAPVEYNDVDLITNDEANGAVLFAEGTFWVAYGNEKFPIYMYNLLPQNIQIIPSKYRTPEGDYFSATIDITLEKTRILTKSLFEQSINGTSVNTKK